MFAYEYENVEYFCRILPKTVKTNEEFLQINRVDARRSNYEQNVDMPNESQIFSDAFVCFSFAFLYKENLESKKKVKLNKKCICVNTCSQHFNF